MSNDTFDKQYLDNINNHLSTLRSDIQQHYIQLSDNTPSLSVHRLKQAILATGDEFLLSYQFKEQVKIYRSKSGRNICKATEDMYKLTWSWLVEFMAKRHKVSDERVESESD